MQPCLEQEEGVIVPTCVLQQSDPVKPERPGLPAAVFWIGIIVLVAVFDLWAYRTGHDTASQFLKHHTGPILKWIGIAAFALLGWHLFKGGPI